MINLPPEPSPFSGPVMKVTPFNTSKYGKELLLDLGIIEEVPFFFGQGKPHMVDFYELIFLRKGKGVLHLDNQSIELKDRLIIAASPYQRKTWKMEGEGKGYFLIFSRNFLELLFADPLFVFRLQFFHNHQTPLFLEEDDESYRFHENAFEQVFMELQDLQGDSEEFIRAWLLLILAGHNRRYCKKYQLTPEKSGNQDAWRFKKLVEEKIRTSPKVEELAQALNISRITLNKRVKATFGVTASHFIKQRLFTEIQKDLLFTNQTVSEISFGLNFSEPHHLIRFFKQLKGQTPAQFRLAYQNGYSNP